MRSSELTQYYFELILITIRQINYITKTVSSPPVVGVELCVKIELNYTLRSIQNWSALNFYFVAERLIEI